ncbi:MAG: cytochrome c [Candidatus Acidiferrum sp.]
MNRHTMRTGQGVLALLLCGAFGLLALPAQAQSDGAALFKTKCAVCHGAEGKGDTGIGRADKIRDLGSPEVQKQTDEELAGIIGNGRGKMPAYGKSLKPEQIKDLVAFIRTLKK